MGQVQHLHAFLDPKLSYTPMNEYTNKSYIEKDLQNIKLHSFLDWHNDATWMHTKMQVNTYVHVLPGSLGGWSSGGVQFFILF